MTWQPIETAPKLYTQAELDTAVKKEWERIETVHSQGMQYMRYKLRIEFDRINDLIDRKERDGSDPFEGWYD